MSLPNSALLSLLLASPLAAQLFPTPVFPTGDSGIALVAVDLDGDGHIDTAVTNQRAQGLRRQQRGRGHHALRFRAA
jgi:hypothetical protein